jgi:hypothetical protein
MIQFNKCFVCLVVIWLNEALLLFCDLQIEQPKLVINNIEVLKKAILVDDSMVSGPMYHDSLIWRIVALGANERCLPIMLATSDRLVHSSSSNRFVCLYFAPY